MKMCFVAQFPPPIHGLSKAVDTLYNSSLSDKYHFSKINITNNRKILESIFKILSSNAQVFYFTISQSLGGNWRDLLILTLIKLKRKKCIIHLHGGYFGQLMKNDCGPRQRMANRYLLYKVDRAIVLGESLKSVFNGYIDPYRIRVVPNCIDDEFKPDNIDKKIEELKNQSRIHITYLSNFVREKGYRELLSTAKLIKDRGMEDHFIFDFAGKFYLQEEKEYFDRYISDNCLSNVIYHGIVEGREKQKILKRGNIFILLSKYPKEGQPISILEAMGNGMAIVTTNHAGIPDIANEENGFICDKDLIEIKDVASYLDMCWENRSYLAKICQRNYQKVMDNFTQMKYIENMDNVFKEVCYE